MTNCTSNWKEICTLWEQVTRRKSTMILAVSLSKIIFHTMCVVKKNPVKRNSKCRKVLILNVRDQNRVFCENNLTGSKETLMTSRNRSSSFTILKKLRCLRQPLYWWYCSWCSWYLVVSCTNVWHAQLRSIIHGVPSVVTLEPNKIQPLTLFVTSFNL